MAVLWADGFDWYNSARNQTDMGTFYVGLISSQVGVQSTTTQFGMGQAASFYFSTGNPNTTSSLFVTGTTESTIYGSIRTYCDSSGGGSGTGAYIAFADGGSISSTGTAQCAIRWNCDGSINLYTGGPGGTLIQSYSSQFLLSQWYSWQFKIVINNTTGSIEIRRNGGTSNAITATGINTRGGTSNSYATGVQFGSYGSNPHFYLDDLFVSSASGTAPTSWVGDLRAVDLTPSAMTQTQLTATGAATTVTVLSNTTATNFTLSTAYYARFVPTSSYTVNSISFLMNANLTGNVKFAILDATGPQGPGNVLATTNAVNNPNTTSNTATFASPPTISAGVTYYVAVDQDTTANFRANSSGTGFSGTLAYSSFATSNPAGLSSTSVFPYMVLNVATNNFSCVSDLPEDADTSYVSTSTVGNEDKYTLTQVPSSYSIVAMQFYTMWKKTDAGARTGQISVAANGSSDTAIITSSSLPTTYGYAQYITPTDPTSASWTASTVNGAVLGVAVTA